MSSQTFYLKYRPALISELDNSEVVEKLSAYLKTGHVPHAFLLVGHKGTGKTSSARLIAKAINCERNLFAKKRTPSSELTIHDDYEPCNKCELCKSITEGNNPDVFEIDAASNTSVEDVRDLRDKVRFSPAISRNKVYIIDEVHMISKSAFNALLKTLEEPPENTVFILATTEAEKVPDTIVSRCAVINFKRADQASIKKSLVRIIHGEKIKIAPPAIEAIAEASSGSFRDGAKILEQAVYLAEGKEITKEIVEKVSGGQSVDEAYKLLELIFSVGAEQVQPLQKSIRIIEDLKERSVDLRGFVKQILEMLHQILLAQVGIENEELIINNIAKNISQEQLRTVIEKFEKAYSEMKFSDVVELPLEMAIIEIAHSEQKIENREPREKKRDEDSQPDFWKNFVEKVNLQSKQLAGVLRSCKLKKQNENTVEIEAVSKFHYDRLHDAKAIDLLQKCALEIIGENVKIVSILKKV